MNRTSITADLYEKYIKPDNHVESNYFGLIKELVAARNNHSPFSEEYAAWQTEINKVYALIETEIIPGRLVYLQWL